MTARAPEPTSMLYHVSEQPDIEYFEPRESAVLGQPVVWAVDRKHLRNYLLPRDCPRVTFYRSETTTAADHAQYLGETQAVVAIEDGWLDRVRTTTLYCYHLPLHPFTCLDAGAGYVVSNTRVQSVGVDVIANPLQALSANNAMLLLVPNLWPLHDAVAASSLQFSMIRMRNALPPLRQKGGNGSADRSMR